MAIKQSALIIGRQPLVEALLSGRSIDKILFQKNILLNINQLKNLLNLYIYNFKMQNLL